MRIISKKIILKKREKKMYCEEEAFYFNFLTLNRPIFIHGGDLGDVFGDFDVILFFEGDFVFDFVFDLDFFGVGGGLSTIVNLCFPYGFLSMSSSTSTIVNLCFP